MTGALPTAGGTVPVATLAVLLVVLCVKHYAADFVLQTTWMAQGKERMVGWGWPLAAHAGVHGLGTLGIALAFAPGLWWLAALDVAVHALIDRGKALASQRTRFPIDDARFWWLFGFDQLLHHLTNVGLAVLLVAA